ncbi:MAG: M56 family metallopeptidase [Lachnospiraceae bacterium]|nr:M56 family metallopeptidase [Butyrivibrio sp.]MCM1342751.1 M56 family metallopeptidase [Muribaculaceae bacterium]MCM1409985.1 M56 family metallopeptidase [Lachnospiraceae bacterium]
MDIRLLFLEIQVAVAVLAILLVRPGLRKLPGVYSYLLWLVVFARLLIPVSLESRFGLMPSAVTGGTWLEENLSRVDRMAGRPVTVNAGLDGAYGSGNISGAGHVDRVQGTGSDVGINGGSVDAGIQYGLGAMTEAGLGADEDHGAESVTGADTTARNDGLPGNRAGIDPDRNGTGENRLQPARGNRRFPTAWDMILLILWAAGAAAILCYNAVALVLVKKRLRGARHLRDNIYVSDQVRSPFTLGIFQPQIYLPADLGETEREYIICHEQVHIRRKDYLVKNLAFLLTALHWFDPFVWTAFYFMERDMEMSCDETVIRKMGQEIKKQYSQSLLDFAKGKCPAAITPITFGENSVKQRVSNVLAYKAGARWAAVPGVMILVLAAALMFTVRSDAQEEGNEAMSGTHSAAGVPAESCGFAVVNAGAFPELIHAGLTLARRFPESALEYWARAYTDKNGDLLFQLAADKENFRQWEKVTQRDGHFVFGDSSPWPWEYDHTILLSQDASTAEITFHMRTSVPEFYLVKETVRITKQDGLYCVDHESTWDNYSIGTAQEYVEAYGQGGIFGEMDNSGNSAGEESSHTGYAEMTALYDDAFYRTILSQLLDGGDQEFYARFTDPVSAARELLHLGAGTGEVTEWNMVSPVRLRSADTGLPEWASEPAPGWLMASSRAGVGSRVIVTYSFAKDGSRVEIPMELKEESLGIWGLAGGSIREVYNTASEPEMLEHDEEGHIRGVYVIELSNYGIYRLGAHSGLTCLWAGDVGRSAAVRSYEGKLYIFESPERAEENSENGTEAVFVVDLLTGELHREHLEIPEDYREVFPKADLGIEGGFVLIYGFGKTYTLPLENQNEVIWNHKTFQQMSEEDRQAYGVENRAYLLENPDTLMRLSVREPEQTSAFIDLDGDNVSEQVRLQAGSGEQWHTAGYYRLQVGESAVTEMASRLHNDIWAYSPDGKEIVLALYEDGASADPRTYLFGYENGKLRALGQFKDDIRACAMKDGVISGRMGCQVIQTDAVYMDWRIGDSGQLEQVLRETYDFTTLNEIELLEELPVQNMLPPMEEGVYVGIDRFIISPQTVRFLQTDSTFSWVYVEAEDGSRGWFRMEGGIVKELDKDCREVFDGLLFYG